MDKMPYKLSQSHLTTMAVDMMYMYQLYPHMLSSYLSKQYKYHLSQHKYQQYILQYMSYLGT